MRARDSSLAGPKEEGVWGQSECAGGMGSESAWMGWGQRGSVCGWGRWGVNERQWWQ